MTVSGDSLPWVNEICYLGVYISKFKHFKCSLDYAKRSFYRAANAIFGKIGRIASEEVTLELVKKMYSNTYIWAGSVRFKYVR